MKVGRVARGHMNDAWCRSYSMMAVSAWGKALIGVLYGARKIAALEHYRIKERGHISLRGAQPHTVYRFRFHGEDNTDTIRPIIFERHQYS
jgi:hypothetical protein